MVLEEATSSSEPSPFSDSLPTSDIDPYASSSNNDGDYHPTSDSSSIRFDQPGVPPIYINMSDVPRPLLVPANAIYAQTISKTVSQNIAMGAKVLQRPVKQEEVEAFAWHLGKALRLGSYGTPIGVSVASLFAYRSRGDRFRFPGWTPMKEGSRFSPDRFGPLRGQFARSAWNFSRVGAYWFIGAFLGQVFFGSYALTTSIAGRMNDPRLKEFLEALKKRQQEGGRLPRPGDVVNSGEGAKMGETEQMARQRRGVQRQAQAREQGQSQGPKRLGRGEDDMSPSGGAFEAELMQGPADTGLMDDRQAKPDYGRGQQGGYGTGQGTDENPSMPTQRRPEQQSSRANGSSWDRLRRDAMSGNQASNPRGARSQPDTNLNNDSFSFSRGDEDKQLAKSEAQRDFDARMEKERTGQDFDDGRGGKRKW